MNDFFCLGEVFSNLPKGGLRQGLDAPPYPPSNEALHVTNTNSTINYKSTYYIYGCQMGIW